MRLIFFTIFRNRAIFETKTQHVPPKMVVNLWRNIMLVILAHIEKIQKSERETIFERLALLGRLLKNSRPEIAKIG